MWGTPFYRAHDTYNYTHVDDKSTSLIYRLASCDGHTNLLPYAYTYPRSNRNCASHLHLYADTNSRTAMGISGTR